ncbi:hypothetical protein A0257_20255 [Hymenobacter psoromatis]|nr:hypothetical protein A0257_20255 [Hymenobacter psoromatis]
MQTAALLDRITTNPSILTGKPVVRGLRISVEQLLKALAAGQTEADLLGEYPELELADLRAVLLFAADAVQSQRVYRLSVG